MRAIKFISVFAIIIIISAFAVAQAAPSQSSTTVKHVAISKSPAYSGKEMFSSYCAVCHGKEGNGDGPAASALKTAPPDLTTLAKRNGGKYPAAHVAAILRGQAMNPSHGSEDMPIWGPLFLSLSQGHDAEVQQRITNLVSYVESLQAK